MELPFLSCGHFLARGILRLRGSGEEAMIALASDINPDSLPAWFALPLAAILWALVLIPVWRSCSADPHNELSQLDCLDGLDSRTD